MFSSSPRIVKFGFIYFLLTPKFAKIGLLDDPGGQRSSLKKLELSFGFE
jgi:hypothetical protein